MERNRIVVLVAALVAVGCDDEGSREPASSYDPTYGEVEGGGTDGSKADTVGTPGAPGPIDTELRVLEIRYLYSGTAKTFGDVDVLSAGLQSMIADIATGGDALIPQVLGTINVEGSRHAELSWHDSVNAILDDPCATGACTMSTPELSDVCSFIDDNEIDQVWIWVDPGDPATATADGKEFSFSSTHTYLNTIPAGSEYCGGAALNVLGLDVTRASVLAFHSFGHSLEHLVQRVYPNVPMATTFFQRCGTIHYTPAVPGTGVHDVECETRHTVAECDYDYDYTSCGFPGATRAECARDECTQWWEVTPAATGYISPDQWGSTELGYYHWWMSKLPNGVVPAVVDGLPPPTVWDFVNDLETSMLTYSDDTVYWVHPDMG